MNKILKKIISSLLLIMMCMSYFMGLTVKATDIDYAELKKIGEADQHLKYYREDSNSYRYIVCTIVGFYKGLDFFPAYCMNKDKIGVSDDYSYSVNVNEIINRDDVWRAVINGYPYKTPGEMGVDNEFDAYTVTKMAVYCLLGESDINKFYADNDDAEAQRMLSSLRNLYNVGKNGTQTRTNGNISVRKEGDFTIAGNYVCQKYKVLGNMEMKNYEIVKFSNLPNGCHVQKTGYDEFTLFLLKDSIDKMDYDVHGKVDVYGLFPTYPVFFGETSIEGTQNYVLTYDKFGRVESSLNIDFELNKSKINVKKVDEVTNQNINNTEFGLYKNDKLITKGVTNNNGDLSFNNLYPGNYKVLELTPNINYYKDNQNYDVSLKFYDQKDLKVTNKHKKGHLKIIKKDKDDNSFLADVEFEIYKENNELVGKYKTNESGEIYVENLNIGKYYLKEVAPKYGYKNVENINFEIKTDETKEIEIFNEKIKGKIQVEKVDRDDENIKVSDAKFGIYNENDELIETLVTDKNGIAISKELPVYGVDYYLKEIEANPNYVLNDEKIKFELKDNETINVKVDNEFKKGDLEIVKIDKDTNENLSGIKFELLDENKNLITEFETDENGKFYYEKLRIGKYYLVEKETREEYVLNTDEKEIKIEYNMVNKIVVENEKIKGRLKIIKTDKYDSAIKLEGVKFEILDEKSNVLDILTTDENGEAFSKYLPSVNRLYTLHEIETLENYILDDGYMFFRINKDNDLIINIKNEKVPEKKEPDVIKEILDKEELPKVEKKEEPKEEIKEENKEETKEIIEEVREVVVVEKILPRTGF